MKTISHLIVLGRIKLTLSLGCVPQNGFLMHSFAHENSKLVQRFHIMLSSASALRIWWSCNNCTSRGVLIYAVGWPLPWCHEGWGHCCHYVSRRSRGPACLSVRAQVQGSGCNHTTLGPAEQRLIENMTVTHIIQHVHPSTGKNIYVIAHVHVQTGLTAFMNTFLHIQICF